MLCHDFVVFVVNVFVIGLFNSIVIVIIVFCKDVNFLNQSKTCLFLLCKLTETIAAVLLHASQLEQLLSVSCCCCLPYFACVYVSMVDFNDGKQPRIHRPYFIIPQHQTFERFIYLYFRCILHHFLMSSILLYVLHTH